MNNLHFLAAEEKHLPLLAEVLNYYVANSTATFHTEVLSAKEMHEKAFFDNSMYGTFLVMDERSLAGYCTLMMWKKQQAYRHTAEVTIYLKPEYTGRNIGAAALEFLQERAVKNDIKTLIAGCTEENQHSVKMFEKNGFVQCAHFHKVGFKFARWLDTVYLQKHL